MFSWLVSTTTALALASSMPALAEPKYTEEEKRHGDRALALAEEGDLAGAAAALRDGWEATGSLRLLAAWAKAEKDAGDCDASLAAYELFFASDPTPEQIATQQPHVDECRARVAATSHNATASSSDSAEVMVPTTCVSSEPWSRDIAGGVLVGLGAAVLITGTGLAVAARVGDARVDSRDTHEGFESQLQRAQRLAYGSYAALAVGGALAIGGIVRYVVVARRGARADQDVSAAPIRGGFVVAWRGRFSLW